MQCAFVGAGAVAEQYAAGLPGSSLELTAVCDLDGDRAARLAKAHGATAYTDVQAMLAAESAPLIINLTSHGAHASVTRQCLEADRHVFSEKPLALDAEVAAGLVETAASRDLALDCAPINHIGGAQCHLATFLGDGRFGPIRMGYAYAHVGRVTQWHDNPDSFLAVGPLYDGAVYPLNLLISWFGPVTRVRVADAIDAWPEREARSPERPAHVEATLAFESGLVVRLTASLYAPHRSREFNSLELHGDDGSVYLSDSGALGTEVESVAVGGLGREYVDAPHPYPPRKRSYLEGPTRLSKAIENGNHPIAVGRRSAHIVAIFNAVEEAAATGDSVAVESHGFDWRSPDPPPVRPPVALRSSSRSDTDGDESTSKAEPGTIESQPHSTIARDAAIRLPPVGFGCSRYRDGEYVDRIDSIATALDAGYRLLDSAELYGNEARIGALLDSPGSPDREGLFLVSKVWRTNHEHVAEAIDGTLDALGVETLDCYMLHWPGALAYQGPLRNLAEKPPAEQERLTFPTDEDGNPVTAAVSLLETWRRLEAVCESGQTRTLGVSNVTREQLETILENARFLPAVLQLEIHPYKPQYELIRYAHEHGLRVMAHSPLSAPGLLDEDVLHDIADEHGVYPAAIVLTWNVGRGIVPIPSSNEPEHVVENFAAARIRLTETEYERIGTLEDPEFER